MSWSALSLGAGRSKWSHLFLALLQFMPTYASQRESMCTGPWTSREIHQQLSGERLEPWTTHQYRKSSWEQTVISEPLVGLGCQEPNMVVGVCNPSYLGG